MHYDINVALNGRHFFATDERSVRNAIDLHKVLTVLLAKFPASEGYTISVTRFELRGESVNVPAFMEQQQ